MTLSLLLSTRGDLSDGKDVTQSGATARGRGGRGKERGSHAVGPQVAGPGEQRGGGAARLRTRYVYYCRTYEKAVSGGERGKRRTCAKGHH